MDLKSFDWRSMQRYFTPQASADLNVFLERLPQNAGQTVLIAAGIAWAAGAAIGLYTTMQLQTLTTLRAELKETEALKPPVPRIRDVPVSKADIEKFTETLIKIYPNLTFKPQGAAIYITAGSTAYFSQFREAIGHVQNGGSGWRVAVEKLCVGRECKGDKLGVLLKINKVSVDKSA
ncbi:MAG: hypothetical protein KDJ15_02335 [Alphaproteobacteria bacterium]|nr:hypothetical protein [Alphaproteobacteria bacterium]